MTLNHPRFMLVSLKELHSRSKWLDEHRLLLPQCDGKLTGAKKESEAMEYEA